MRIFSMTKALACTVLYILKEKGVVGFESPVSDYIPSFNRTWEIVDYDKDGPHQTDYVSFMTGKTTTLNYRKSMAKNQMLVKHCMSECSGIGYD
jgi:CubicO group peptidase (beta-lactamase class C family)